LATTHDPILDLQSLPISELNKVAGAYFGPLNPIESVKCQFTKLDVTSIGIGTVALIRATGEARISGINQPWSSIVKIVEPDAKSAFGDVDPTSSGWSEIHAYQENLFESQSEGFRGAKCYRIDDRGNGQQWIWMEDLSEYSGSNWSRDEYVLAANGIGKFKSAWLQKNSSQIDWLPKYSRATELDSDELLTRNQTNFLNLKNSDYFREGAKSSEDSAAGR